MQVLQRLFALASRDVETGSTEENEARTAAMLLFRKCREWGVKINFAVPAEQQPAPPPPPPTQPPASPGWVPVQRPEPPPRRQWRGLEDAIRDAMGGTYANPMPRATITGNCILCGLPVTGNELAHVNCMRSVGFPPRKPGVDGTVPPRASQPRMDPLWTCGVCGNVVLLGEDSVTTSYGRAHARCSSGRTP